MSVVRSVAVIGAGIGGLTVTNALMRLGLKVSLYERSPCFMATAGAGFGLQPNGQISLEYIGFERIKDLIQPFHLWQVIDDYGRPISVSTRLKDYEQRFGYAIGGALRADLVDLLKKPIEEENCLFYSHRAKKFEQDSDGVTVTFDHNQEEKFIRADLVIGADGIHSTVVDLVFGQSSPAVHSKENIFYGVIENIDSQTSIDSSVRDKNTLTQYFNHGEFISYRTGNRGHFIWAATYPANSPPINNGDGEWTRMNNQREFNSFLKRFPQTHPIHQCAEATKLERLLHFGLFYRQHRADGWHRGRICLLGDSCHATLPYTGQGANMAIEDGVVLALCLEKHRFHIEPALQEYYRKRFERTKRAVNMARYMGLFLHSENIFIRTIRQKTMSRLMNSESVLKHAEQEMYKHCPIPLKIK